MKILFPQRVEEFVRIPSFVSSKRAVPVIKMQIGVRASSEPASDKEICGD